MTFYPKGSLNTDVTDGAIRWSGSDFEGRMGGVWISFTAGGGVISINSLTDGYTDATNNVMLGDVGQGAFVALGTANNTVLGRSAGIALTTGADNLFLGFEAGVLTNIGGSNTFIGSHAGASNVSGDASVGIGTYALNRSNTFGNTGIGAFAGFFTTGNNNMFLGYNSGYTNSTGVANSGIGTGALYGGNFNNRTGIGRYALGFGGGGENSTGVGFEVMYNVTGDRNTALGAEAGHEATTQTDCVYLGYRAGYNNALSNRLYIGNSATSFLITGDFAASCVGINTNDLDGTPEVGSLTVRGDSADGTTKALVLRDSTEAGVFSVDTDGSAQNLKFKITAEGGYAVRLTNNTGGNSVKGMLVKASTTTDDAFVSTGTDDAMPFGAVYESGIADGQPCWVVMGGIAEVLLEDGVAGVHGYWCRTSVTAAGRMTQAAAPPGGGVNELDQHEHEIGHCLQSVGSGTSVLCRIILHFN